MIDKTSLYHSRGWDMTSLVGKAEDPRDATFACPSCGTVMYPMPEDFGVFPKKTGIGHGTAVAGCVKCKTPIRVSYGYVAEVESAIAYTRVITEKPATILEDVA